MSKYRKCNQCGGMDEYILTEGGMDQWFCTDCNRVAWSSDALIETPETRAIDRMGE